MGILIMGISLIFYMFIMLGKAFDFINLSWRIVLSSIIWFPVMMMLGLLALTLIVNMLLSLINFVTKNGGKDGNSNGE